jgi:hypothetical protein
MLQYVPWVFTFLFTTRVILPFNTDTNNKISSLITSLTLGLVSQFGPIHVAQHLLFAYVVSDSFLKLYTGFQFDIALHHALTLVLIYTTQNRPETSYLIKDLMLMEFTTPFLYLAFILRNLKIQKTIMYVSFVLALCLWPVLRLMVPLSVALEALQYDYVGAYATFCLLALQVYWYIQLLQHAWKMCFKPRPEPIVI